MNNKIVGLVVGIALGIIVMANVLMPVLVDSTATERTFDNSDDSLFFMEKIENVSNYSFSWVTGSDSITVNGETMVLPSNPNSYTLVCITDDMAVRFVDSALAMQVIGEVITTDGATGINISVDNGTLVLNNGVATLTKENANGFVIMPSSASHVMKSPDQGAYVLPSTELLGMGITTVEGVWNVGFSISGTPDNLTVSKYSGSASYNVSNIATSLSEVEGFVDLINIDSISFDIENPTSGYSGSILYNYFIVPAEVTASYDEPRALYEYSGIIFVIPVIILAAILLVAVGLFYNRY